MDLGYGRDFMELMSRKSYSVSGNFNVAANSVDTLSPATLQILIPLEPNFAIRPASIDVFIADFNATGKLKMLNGGVVLNTQSGNLFGRSYGYPFAGQVIGAGGVNLHISEDEPIFWTDYSNQGGSGEKVQCLAVFDVANSDAAIHAASVFMQAVIETYKVRLPTRVFLS